MAQGLSLTAFKEKLYSDKFSKSELNAMLSHQGTAKISPQKGELIKNYLRGIEMQQTKEPQTSILPTATRNTITMPAAASEYPPMTNPDTDDAAVARKFLQVLDSARKRGIEFTLSLADVKLLIKKKKCYYTDLPFDYSDKEKSLTFDRINSKLGYIKGNVVACRYDVNQLKNILIEHEVSVFKDNPKLLIKCVQKWEIK